MNINDIIPVPQPLHFDEEPGRLIRLKNKHLYDEYGNEKENKIIRCVRCKKAQHPFRMGSEVNGGGVCFDCEESRLSDARRRRARLPPPGRVKLAEQEVFSMCAVGSRLVRLTYGEHV